MAEKRMFAKSIVLTDAFLDMPMSARCLYFTLGMLADDDGFVGSPKSIMRQCGASEDDLKILLSKRYLLAFDSGVVVIKHWLINNYLRPDRYHPTTYQEELALLETDQKGAYTELAMALPNLGIPPGIPDGYQMDPDGIQNGNPDKNSIDKNSKDKKREVAHAHGEYGWVKLTDAQYDKLLQDLGKEELDRCIRYVDESAQKTTNRNGWKDWNLTIRNCSRDKWGLDKKGSSKPKQFVTAAEYVPPKPVSSAKDIWNLVDKI